MPLASTGEYGGCTSTTKHAICSIPRGYKCNTNGLYCHAVVIERMKTHRRGGACNVISCIAALVCTERHGRFAWVSPGRFPCKLRQCHVRDLPNLQIPSGTTANDIDSHGWVGSPEISSNAALVTSTSERILAARPLNISTEMSWGLHMKSAALPLSLSQSKKQLAARQIMKLIDMGGGRLMQPVALQHSCASQSKKYERHCR